MYLVIAVSHVILRKRAIKAGQALLVKFLGFPLLSCITIFAILGFLCMMAIVPGHQAELVVSAVLTAALIVIGMVLQARDKP